MPKIKVEMVEIVIKYDDCEPYRASPLISDCSPGGNFINTVYAAEIVGVLYDFMHPCRLK